MGGLRGTDSEAVKNCRGALSLVLGLALRAGGCEHSVPCPLVTHAVDGWVGSGLHPKLQAFFREEDAFKRLESERVDFIVFLDLRGGSKLVSESS